MNYPVLKNNIIHLAETSVDKFNLVSFKEVFGVNFPEPLPLIAVPKNTRIISQDECGEDVVIYCSRMGIGKSMIEGGFDFFSEEKPKIALYLTNDIDWIRLSFLKGGFNLLEHSENTDVDTILILTNFIEKSGFKLKYKYEVLASSYSNSDGDVHLFTYGFNHRFIAKPKFIKPPEIKPSICNRSTVFGRREYKTYLMKDTSTGLYKIGRSTKPLDREKTLQSEKPTIKMVWTTKDDIEKELHDKYSDQRVRGEWFSLNPIQVKYITTKYL